MKLLRAILTILLFLTLGLVGFSFVPPGEYEPPRRASIEESDFRLAEKAGWYRVDDGVYWLITWGAESGLTLVRFNPLTRKFLKPKSADLFTWEKDGRSFQVDFGRTESEEISGVRWTDEQVCTIRAFAMIAMGTVKPK